MRRVFGGGAWCTGGRPLAGFTSPLPRNAAGVTDLVVIGAVGDAKIKPDIFLEPERGTKRDRILSAEMPVTQCKRPVRSNS